MEILKSLYLLFGPLNKALIRDLLASPDRPSPHDKLLQQYCEENTGGRAAQSLARWSKQEFKYLWPSIKYLEHFLHDVEPSWFIKLIYRDRRNSYAYLTFLWVSRSILWIVCRLIANIKVRHHRARSDVHFDCLYRDTGPEGVLSKRRWSTHCDSYHQCPTCRHGGDLYRLQSSHRV